MTTPRSRLVLVAAGKGERLKAKIPKAWIAVAGKPLLMHSLERFHAEPWIDRIALVVERAWVGRARAFVKAKRLKKVVVVAGGERRQDSVANGARALTLGRSQVCLVHDAARPVADADLARRVAVAAKRDGASVAAVPVADTLKRSGPNGLIATTVSRLGLWQAQTPQAVRGDLVSRWLELLDATDVTDDVQPLEASGLRVKLVPASRTNLKVTWPEDVIVAEKLMAGETRSGIGVDLHRLEEGRPLILGGVRIPFHKGPDGHSDADLVCHALTDALLGATGGGDIGKRFGVAKPSTKNLRSTEFLRITVAEARSRGWRPVNADVTVILQAPKLGAYREKMRTSLAGILGLSLGRVSVKATTAKKTGAIGEGAAIGCVAIVAVAAARG